MAENTQVLGLVGSPNKNGRTNQLVSAALDGAAKAGAKVELVQMSDYVVDACKDCLPWVCAKNKKCTYPDDGLDFLSQKMLNCGALVLGTPVYWGDTSGMVRYLMLKMFRIYAMSGDLYGLPAFGIAIAGGSGNGLMSGLQPLYHFFKTNRMRALEPLPATRFDMKQAEQKARDEGTRLATLADKRHPFATRDECLIWYDNLPYINESRAAERRLLAALTLEAVPPERRNKVDGDLAQADIINASGRDLDALLEATKVYDSAIKLIDQK